MKRAAKSVPDFLMLHGCAGPLEGTVGGGNGYAEQFCNLDRFPTQYVTQDKHGALSSREGLQRGQEGQRDAFPRLIPGLRVGQGPVVNKGIGQRFEPYVLQGRSGESAITVAG